VNLTLRCRSIAGMTTSCIERPSCVGSYRLLCVLFDQDATTSRNPTSLASKNGFRFRRPASCEDNLAHRGRP